MVFPPTDMLLGFCRCRARDTKHSLHQYNLKNDSINPPFKKDTVAYMTTQSLK
jgi:hypothetical protein